MNLDEFVKENKAWLSMKFAEGHPDFQAFCLGEYEMYGD